MQTVSWYMKTWDALTESDKQALAEHMGTFDTKEQAKGYALYLKNHCGVPFAFTYKHITD